MEIITNNVPRDILQGYELTDAEKREFDYVNWFAVLAGEENAEFVRYKGTLYHLQDTERVTNNLFPNWDGYVSETFFSGVLFRYVNDFEQIICGRYYS